MKSDDAIKYQSDWLLDAIATATQNRAFLRGDSECDEVACEAIVSNAQKAMRQLLIIEFDRIRIALGGYPDSDLMSLATTLKKRNTALEIDVEQLCKQIAGLTTCDCGERLSAGQCQFCDNDE